jgi:excisionase family DNA binding protein
VEEFYRLSEVATKLKVHPKTVSRLIGSGKLRAVKVASLKRVSESEIERFLEDNAVRPRVKQTEPKRQRRGRRERGFAFSVFDPV